MKVPRDLHFYLFIYIFKRPHSRLPPTFSSMPTRGQYVHSWLSLVLFVRIMRN
jgi:hypothetical protein